MACATTDARMRLLAMQQELQSQAMSKELMRRRAVELSAVRAALQRIEDGHYGDCEACGDPINPRRLELDPTARLCVDCASAAEN